MTAGVRRAVHLFGPTVVILTLAALALTPWSAAVVIGVSVLATLAPLVGVLLYRPVVPGPYYVTFGMLTSFTTAVSIPLLGFDGVDAWAAVLSANMSGKYFAVILLLHLFVGYRRHRARRPRRRKRLNVDTVLLAAIVALVTAQLTSTTVAHAGSSVDSTGAAYPAVNVLMAGLILRFALSRANISRAGAAAMIAALAGTSFDALCGLYAAGVGYERLAPPAGDWRWAVWIVAVGAWGWSCLHLSMRSSWTRLVLESRRSESYRLLGLAPLTALPLALYAVGREIGGALPPSLYLAASVVIAAVGLIRGAAAVRDNEHLARRDPLTGLLNRRGLAEAFDSTVTASPDCALCIVDVDDFKEVNDTYGHDAGDLLLTALATRLEAAIGRDGIVSRAGGDEFVLLLPGRHADPAAVISRALAEPFDVMGSPRQVRASGGLAWISPGVTMAHALADADVALYSAKAGGRGAVVEYRPQHREEVLGRLAMVRDLQQLLDGASGAGSLEVHYQPIAELVSGRVVGCEALVRWRRPGYGLVRPDTFLPLAEQHGLAARLDRLVLEATLVQIGRWRRAGFEPVPVSVNLGRSSIEAPDLAEVVLTALDELGIDPSLLHLEITEHDQLPPEAGAESLGRLADAGVVISLDDFGVGYTSLDYLRRYPIGQLKLDRSITAVLQTEPTTPLLEGIVALAKALDVQVVVEGVETQAQQDRLAALGIAVGQGYHLATPRPAAGMRALLAPVGTAPAPIR